MLARVARALRGRYPIRDMVGHSDIAPGRKTDPGAAFDWPRLGRLLGVPPTDGAAGIVPNRGQAKGTGDRPVTDQRGHRL
jgi:N-acetyl-anhydromuramyl-L-alanine amidase AmpD